MHNNHDYAIPQRHTFKIKHESLAVEMIDKDDIILAGHTFTGYGKGIFIYGKCYGMPERVSGFIHNVFLRTDVQSRNI